MVIDLDDVTLNYEEMGEGYPLLLLHGWGGSINSMAPIWQFFKRKRKVYVIDFPGQNNGSSKLKVPWGVPEYAKLIKDFMEKKQIHQPDVIAHSFGGRVAIAMASKSEEIFRKIVLVDAAGVKPKNSFRKKLKQRLFKSGKWFYKHTLSVEKYEKKMDSLRKKYGSSDYAALSSDVMRQTFQKIVELDLTNELEKIKNETLLVWGSNDVDTPLSMAQVMKEKIPNAKLVVLESAAHFSYLDSPTQFHIAVDQFLENESWRNASENN